MKEPSTLTDLKVQAGQTLAIIGGPGSGKSSLVNLIPHLLTNKADDLRSTVNRSTARANMDLHQEISTQQTGPLYRDRSFQPAVWL
ncbi:ATP-binding cassette domain-containing protein [Limosilactobacillus fermentum]